jgi:hypothetical protein
MKLPEELQTREMAMASDDKLNEAIVRDCAAFIETCTAENDAFHEALARVANLLRSRYGLEPKP